jgi:hypothetical protein
MSTETQEHEIYSVVPFRTCTSFNTNTIGGGPTEIFGNRWHSWHATNNWQTYDQKTNVYAVSDRKPPSAGINSGKVRLSFWICVDILFNIHHLFIYLFMERFFGPWMKVHVNCASWRLSFISCLVLVWSRYRQISQLRRLIAHNFPLCWKNTNMPNGKNVVKKCAWKFLNIFNDFIWSSMTAALKCIFSFSQMKV